jgi:D-alanine-D-alanine ligase
MSTVDRSADWETLARYRELARARANDIAVLVVANLAKNKTAPEGDTDRSTEYFSESELEQIVHGFRSFGFYCDVFIGESEFIKWVEGGGASHFPDRKIVVYSAAQSGTGAGRKSLVPAVCALHGLSYVNSDPYTTSLARHKFHGNAILRSLGIPAPRCWWYLPTGVWLNGEHPPVGTHIITKSTFESASIGIGSDARLKYERAQDAKIAALAQSLGQGVVVQEFISGMECETPVVGAASHIALGPAGISIDQNKSLGNSFLDYDRVYFDKYGFYDFAEEAPEIATKISEIATRAATALGLGGYSRVDFRIADSGQAYVTDISTTPHLIDHSAYAFCFGIAGWSRADMLGLLVGLTLPIQDSVQN